MIPPIALTHELRWVHDGALPAVVLAWIRAEPPRPAPGPMDSAGVRGRLTLTSSIARHLRGGDPDVAVVEQVAGRGDGEREQAGVIAGNLGRRRRAGVEVAVLSTPALAVVFGPRRAGRAMRWQRDGLCAAQLRRLRPGDAGSTREAEWVTVCCERWRRGSVLVEDLRVDGAPMWSVAVELPPEASPAALGLVARQGLADFPLADALSAWAVPSLAARLAAPGRTVDTGGRRSG